MPKLQVCPRCAAENLPATYICGPDCPANPAAWRPRKRRLQASVKLSPFLKRGLGVVVINFQRRVAERRLPAVAWQRLFLLRRGALGKPKRTLHTEEGCNA